MRRRLSQLELALSASVSQRHLSYLESGRARPSRGMILNLSEALDVPLRERNEWLMAAGFAAAFKTRQLDDPQMAQVMRAIQMMLKGHEPFPAVAVDRAWNVRASNTPFDRMADFVGGRLWTELGGEERNLMRLLFHPKGLRPFVKNWDVIAPLLWQRAAREAESLGGAEMKAVLAELEPLQDPAILSHRWSGDLVPVMAIEIAMNGIELSLFTVIATFGTAQDVTTDELRIESFFPADDVTERFFRAAPGDNAI